MSWLIKTTTANYKSFSSGSNTTIFVYEGSCTANKYINNPGKDKLPDRPSQFEEENLFENIFI